MPVLKLTITVTDDSNQYEEEVSFDFEELRTIPNPRQAITAKMLAIVRPLVNEVDPSIDNI